MVKHIVLFTFLEGVDKQAGVKAAADALEPLVGQIPGLVKLEVRPLFQGGMDFILYSELESREDLSVYADHPLHQQAKDKFFQLLDKRLAADYEI